MRFVHELEKLIDDSFEELPVCFEEPRILSNDVHDIRCHDRLVVLSALHFNEAQKFFDDSDQESFLLLFVCNESLVTKKSSKTGERTHCA